MNGIGHYQEAEECLAWVDDLSGLDEVSLDAIQITLQKAQIHATLALAAATAASLMLDGRELHNEAWRAVTS